ncbi:MAG: stomatin-like protein [Pseudanabaenaceae cyanobacterium SKYGB_i_bin29]|nr:paraslipin [Pseudanabaenaceae cyanobacterium SKYG29]MDW8421974.1 stomatin-like protein [Pseudanabaenaceae cyanobacterium SKYGB_i_bin29]
MNPLQPLVIVTVVAVITLMRSVRVIQQGEEALVATFGRYKRKLQPGLNFVVPVVDSIVCRRSIKEQVLDIPPQECITRDNVRVTVDAVVYWRIVDMVKAHYKVENLVEAMINLVRTQIRNEIGNLELDQTFTARAKVNEVLLRDLDEATDPWGVKVTRVELRDILPARAVQDSMELQMTAERKKRAAILTSEGERESAINIARGKADAQLLEAEANKKATILAAEAQQQSRILRAEAERQERILQSQGTAEAIRIIQEASHNTISAESALQYILALNYMQMGTTIGSSSSSKVIFLDPKAIPAALEGIKSILSAETDIEA